MTDTEQAPDGDPDLEAKARGSLLTHQLALLQERRKAPQRHLNRAERRAAAKRAQKGQHHGKR